MAKSYKKNRKGGKRRVSLKRRFRRGMKGGSGGGCSSCQVLKGGSRKKRGGDATILSLAYPANNAHYARNPNLAFTGESYNNPNLGPPNSALANAYPNPGPTPTGFNFLNPLNPQFGGKYPNGLTGDTWTSSPSTWPGVQPEDSNGNHYALNTYDNDVSRQMIDVGPAPPYAIGGRRRRRKTRSKRGGFLLNDNSLIQDAVNVGRQIKTGFGGVYNGLSGYQGPVSPLPWKGQLQNTTSLNSLKYK